jgi:peptidase E
MYREDSFFRENNMDKNNKIRLELQKLIDQLHLSKNAMEKLSKMVIVENEDLSSKLDNVKNNVEVLLDYLEQKRNSIQFIPTANVL